MRENNVCHDPHGLITCSHTRSCIYYATCGCMKCNCTEFAPRKIGTKPLYAFNEIIKVNGTLFIDFYGVYIVPRLSKNQWKQFQRNKGKRVKLTIEVLR